MTIAEVSRQYDISADTLRYYERVGLIPSVTRNKSGFRDYSEEDCNWVSFIKCMRRAGVQVEALIEYVSLYQRGNGTQEARKQLLIEQRDLLKAKTEEMLATLQLLENKIERYDQWNPHWENTMAQFKGYNSSK